MAQRTSVVRFGVVALALVMLALGFTPLGPRLAAQTAPTVGVTVTDATVDPRSGLVTLTLTVTCSAPANVSLSAYLQQYVGRTKAISGYSGFPSPTVACPGPEGETVTLTLVGQNGRFGPGSAILTTTLYACVISPDYPGPCYPSSPPSTVTQAIRLRSAR